MLIAHLSDPHVCAPGELYQGLVDSNAMLAAAVARVLSLEPQPDLVVITGDITEHATEAEYRHARALLAPLSQPILAIPGNHDEREAFRRAFGDLGFLPEQGPLNFAASSGPVRVVGLDISVPGRHHGEVDDASAAWLDAALSADPERPTIILMHQPPFEIGVGFIDVYRCFGAERLEQVVVRHRQVERVLCGHVHRHSMRRFGGTLAITAPSTTTAIALRLADGAVPASFVEPPAILLHDWRPETGLVTHFLPVDAGRGPLAFF